MAVKYLATYLNDHLAGSVTVLELLDHLRKTYTDTETGQLLTGLHEDIKADRLELEALMRRLNIPQSGPRQVGTWLAEKVVQIKLRWDDAADGPMHLLEALDIVASGVEGKRCLWRALASAAEAAPELRGTDYGRLEQRADEQRLRMEGIRLAAARVALIVVASD